MCARNANGIVCVAHNNKDTRQRIHVSLTHSQPSTAYVRVIHTDISNSSERGWIFSKHEHFLGSGIFFFSYIRSIIIPHACIAYMCSIRRQQQCICSSILPNYFFFDFLRWCGWFFSFSRSLLCSRRMLFFLQAWLDLRVSTHKFCPPIYWVCIVKWMIIISLISYLTTDELHIYEFISIIKKKKVGRISFILVWWYTKIVSEE